MTIDERNQHRTVTSYPKFTLVRLVVAIVALALLLGVVLCISVTILETEGRRVHPAEQHIADYIQELGGSYHADAKNGWHITGVWLQITATTDRDVEVVTQLQYLKNLDVADSRVTEVDPKNWAP